MVIRVGHSLEQVFILAVCREQVVTETNLIIVGQI